MLLGVRVDKRFFVPGGSYGPGANIPGRPIDRAEVESESAGGVPEEEISNDLKRWLRLKG